MATISGCRYHKVNLKAKIYIYVNSTTQRFPNNIIKIFLLEGFFHLPPVSLTPVANLELRISPRIFEKIRNVPNGIIRGGGNWFKKKNRRKKSRDTVPLSPAMGAKNQEGIGLSYRPASLRSLATQFQTRFLESIPRPIAGLKFSTLIWNL
jgi:hypothetical protein